MFAGCASTDLWITVPMLVPVVGCTLWALVTAIRFRNWIWVGLLLAMPVFGAFLYFFFHLHQHGPSGFELPGAHDQTRIKRLQAEIARIDKAHLHAQLGDIYFQIGKLDRALTCYRAALERDPDDLDARAHLGGCLVRLGRAAEARPLLEAAVAENPRHDRGHTLMALAEAASALGEIEVAIATWKRVVASNSYARARVQLAELYVATGDHAAARHLLRQVLDDDDAAPAFHRRREAVWVRRARAALRRIPATPA